MSFDFSVKFKVVDKISAKIDAINKKMGTISDKADKVSSRIKSKLGTGFTSKFKLRTKEALDKIKDLKKKIKDIGKKAVIGGTAVLAGIGATILQSQKIAKVQGEIKSLGISEKGIDIITEKARNLSNTLAGITQTDFITGAYDIKSGIESLSNEGVAQYTEWAAKTAVATKSSILEMGQLFAMGYGVFRGQFDDDFEFGKAFSASVSTSVQMFRTEGKDIVDGLGRIKGAATAHNIAMAEQFAVLGVAKSAYKSMSEAATGYDSFLRGAVKAQDKLNLSFVDSAGMMLPMEKIIERIKDKYGELSSAEIDNIATAFGGSEAGAFVNTMANNIDKVVEARKKLNIAQTKGLELTNQMAEAMQRGREFELLGQQMGNMFANIGKVFAPVALKIAGAFGRMSIAIQKFTKENPKLAKIIGYTIAIMAGLAVVLGTVAIAMWAVSLPVIAVIAGVTLLVAGLVALYEYWGEIKKFIFGDNQFETWGDSVKGVFDALTAPIRLVIKLIDMFLSKFDIYNNAKKAITGASEATWDWIKNKTGFGDDESTNSNVSTIDNTVKNHSVIDVNVTATGGAKADTASKSTGGVKLRTVENGIGG